MRNKRGQTVNERLEEEIQYIGTLSNSTKQQTLAHKAVGSVNLAVEFGLITYTEWEQHITDIFRFL